MAVLGSILLNRTLKQFLDCQDLESSKGVELTEKIRDSANDSMGIILKSIPSTDNPHGEILIDICVQATKDGLVDVLFENLDDDTTLTRDIATQVLTKSSNISSTRLFKRLHETDVSKAQIIEILELQNELLKPEEIISNAIKLDQDYAEQLFKLIEGTKIEVNLNALSFQPGKITNANLKIGLLRYLGNLDQGQVAGHIGKFLADKNKIIAKEALKSLDGLKVNFDVSILLPYLESMDEADREIALEILNRQANADLIVQLAPWMAGKSEWLREALAKLVAQHVNQENLEDFLLRLDLEDWLGKEQAVKSLLKMGTILLFKVAQRLVDHKQEFVRDTALQLAAQQADPANLKKIGEIAMHDIWQIREQGIVLLGDSGQGEALVPLKQSLEKWPESAVAILKAVDRLKLIKGLEIAFYCLKLSEALAQRKALDTIRSLTTQKYAENVRKNLLKRVPSLHPIVKDTAEEVVNKLTGDYGLSELNLDHDFFDTHLVKADQSVSGNLLNIEDLKAGDTWMGRFRIKREIGRGAMGRVFLVEDEMVSERLILKFMHPELTADSGSMERFMREVKYSRMVTHGNVIRIHDLLSVDDLCAISMEYFESRGIDEILKEIKIFDVKPGLKILYQVSEGMVAAHYQEVIHRDLKPSNILMDQSGLVKVVDFGIASASESADDTITQVDSIIGTPAYLSPERANGMEAHYRCDIYALGIIAYRMFTGQLPYRGEPLEILAKHIEGKAPSIHEVDDSISPEVGMLVQKMMAPKAENRFQTMQQVSSAIKGQLQKL